MYKGTLSGPYGARMNNAPIPTCLVEKHAGKDWTKHEVRESIAGVDELLKMSTGNGDLSTDVSNLIPLLQDKIYEDYTCMDIRATIPRAAIAEIHQVVRSRILDLTIELEKSIPAAALVPANKEANHEKVQQISQQIIYGDVNTAVVGGHGANIDIKIEERDKNSFIEHLVTTGFPREDVTELAKILETEEPSSAEEPFGQNAKNWIVSNLKKAAEGTWDMGISVATKFLTAAALKYYGL